MVDPFTAIGLATNIIQLIEVGAKVVKTGHELTASGTTKAYEDLKAICAETVSVCDEVKAQLGESRSVIISREKKRKVAPGVDDIGPQGRRPKQSIDSDISASGRPGSGSRIDASRSQDALSFQTFSGLNVQSMSENLRSSSSMDSEEQEGIRALATKTNEAAKELSAFLEAFTLSEKQQAQHTAERRHQRASTALKLSFKGLGKETALNKMRKTLEGLQQGMILRLLATQGDSMLQLNMKLDDVLQRDIAAAERRSMTLEQILLHFGTRAALYGISDDQRATLDGALSSLHKQGLIVLSCWRVLKTLVFAEAHSREDAIPEAHKATFSWIFDSVKTDFVDWLSAGNGTFWITGKPGSGKSTLMKYLVYHTQTLEHLYKWSGSDKLGLAFFCFWNAGTPMQKSQTGLLRTLLIRIIQECPELAFEHIPPRFRTSDELAGIMPWRHCELVQTVRDIAANLRSGTHLCFFIDGLDEYEGEHIDLIGLISDICEQTPCIKVCVSSRPWNVFTRAYHNRAAGTLRVQKLTENDIKAYIVDEMTAEPAFQNVYLSDPKGCDRLMVGISTKAQGVFLWVYLVVRSLLRGLRNNGDDLKILARRLDSYPDTLDEYFDRMLKRIEKVYWTESSRLLLLAMSAERSLPFWAPRCVEVEAEDESYAATVVTPPSARDISFVYGCDCSRDPAEFNLVMAAHRARSTLLVLGSEELVNHDCHYLFGEDNEYTCRQRAQLRQYLDARTADLLEVVKDGIVFVHRTARDFLVRSDLSLDLYKSAGQNYDVGTSLMKLGLLSNKRDEHMRSLFKRTGWNRTEITFVRLLKDIHKQRGLLNGNDCRESDKDDGVEMYEHGYM